MAHGARRSEWPRIGRALLAVLFFAAVVLTFAFIALPVIAIFIHVPPGKLLDQLSNPVVTDALIVTHQDDARRAGR